MSGIASSALNVALAVALRPEILGIMSALLIFMVTMLLTWLILRSTYVAYSDAFAPYEAVLFLRLETLGGSLVLLGLAVPRSVIEAARSVFDIVTSDVAKIATTMVLGIAALTWLNTIPEIAAAGERIRCANIGIVEDFLLPLLNLARLLYNTGWPIANVVFEVQKFLLTGYQKVLESCVSGDDIFIVLQAAALAVAELARALGQFFSTGMLTSRLDLATFFYQVGLAANAALGPLICFCSILEDLWNLVVGIPQIDELHHGLSSAVNVGVRAFQMIMNSLLSFGTLSPTPPDFSQTAEELISAEVLLLEFARIVILHVVEFLVALLDTIGIIIPAEYDAVLKESLAMTYNDAGVTTLYPGKVTLADMMHATLRTSASPLSTDVNVQSPIWDLPENATLSDILGLRRILILLSTRWSYIVSKPVAAGVSIINGTLNMIGNSFDLFDTPDGLRYFQFGVPFDYLREALGAVANLGVILDTGLPAATKGTTDGLLFYVEAVFEIFFGFLFAIIFPRWLPGLNPPTNCSVVGTCSYPAPSGWTVFKYFPAYYDWEGNAIRQSLRTFENNSNAIGILLGCDNNTIATDNCTDLRRPYWLKYHISNPNPDP